MNTSASDKNITGHWIHDVFSVVNMDASVARKSVFPCVCRAGNNGTLFVVDELGHSVLALDEAGSLKKNIGGKGEPPGCFHYPTDIAISPVGELLVTDRWNHCIQVFDETSLEFKKTIGSRGRGAGEFLEPWSVVFINDNIIVSERENERLSIFDRQGRFIAHRRELFGYDFPLGCVSALAVVGRFLILLMNAFEILVIDEWFHVENTIRLPNGIGPVAALYPMGPDTFAVSTDMATLALFSLDGTRIATRKICLNTTVVDSQPADDNAIRCLITDIENKTFGIVSVPAMPHPFENELSDFHERGGEAAQDAAFYSRIATGRATEIDSWPESVKYPGPAKFLFSKFQAAMGQYTDHPEAVEDILLHFMKSVPAVTSFFKAVETHTQLPQSLKKRLGGIHIKPVMRIPLHDQRMASKYVVDMAIEHSGDIRILLNPSGMCKIGARGFEISGQNEPEDGMEFRLLADGSFLLATLSREIILCDPQGQRMRTILSLPPVKGAMRQRSISMSLIDDNTFYAANENAQKVEIYDIHRPGDPVEQLPVAFDRPYHLVFDATRKQLFVLEITGDMNVIGEEHQIISRFPVPRPSPEWRIPWFARTPDGTLLFVLLLELGSNYMESILALDSNSGEMIFDMSAYSLSQSAHDDVRGLHVLKPLYADPISGFWFCNFMTRELIKFDTIENMEQKD